MRLHVQPVRVQTARRMLLALGRIASSKAARDAMLVYRDAVRSLSSREVREELGGAIGAGRRGRGWLAALLVAGEVEAALSDSGAPGAGDAARLSDALARAWLAGAANEDAALERLLARLRLPDRIVLKRPEGYAYYALDPGAYAALARTACEDDRVAVVGVRSIGSSLSAVMSAGLAARGVDVRRITLRPEGHPFDRRLVADAGLERFVAERRGSRFVIVDEGPGLSGSTFLATAEGLEALGVPSARILLVTSHPVDAARLVAPRAAERWSRFLAAAVATDTAPSRAARLDGGEWRRLLYPCEREWPACWTLLERRKYLREDGTLIKFIGFPPYGDAALERGQVLAEAGYTPRVSGAAPGYVAQRFESGRPLGGGAPLHAYVERALDYLAFRHSALRAASVSEGLEHMLRVNAREALGVELPDTLRLEVARPVYADGRMLPHEWIRTDDGRVLKVDAVDHGDDHLWPGACDAAWDVAGLIVEWCLDAETEELSERYRARTGDSVAERIGPYLAAYAAFQLGRADLAARSSAPSEGERWRAERARYERALKHALARARIALPSR